MAKLRQTSPLAVRDYMLQSLQPIETYRVEYPQLIFRQVVRNIIHVTVPTGGEADFERLSARGELLQIPALYGLYGREALVETNIATFHNYPFATLTGRGVVIGFVDTGIDYVNKLFRNEDGTTRILRIWDQTLEGNHPIGYDYGTEYTAEMINQALNAENPYEIVPSYDEIGHGTFLAGVAAGDDKTGLDEYRGGAPDAYIAMVKLKPAKNYLKDYYLIERTDEAYEENDFLAGLNYLAAAAGRLRLPLVICIGMGDSMGAHNGTTIVESYLNEISIIQDLVVVAAAGNEANNGHHFSGTIAQGEMQDVEVNVSAEETRGFIANLWTQLADKIALSIRSPIGQVIEVVPIIPNETTTYTFGLEATVITITYNYPDVRTGAQNTIVRFERPTPGTWSVTVHGLNVVNGYYNIWLQRDEFITDDTIFLRAETLTTIAIPATTEYVIAVGAYDYMDQSIYGASGRGPTAAGVTKPDFIAPGVNVSGPLAGGGYGIYAGTSISAAVTASAAALLMQWAVVEQNLRDMNTRIARGIFIRGADRRRGIDYPNPTEGYGRLDLRNALAGI